MKTLTPLYCVLSLILSQSAIYADGFYKWKDARGNTQYGDRPPANANAQPMDLPKITIINNYADQWKPMDFVEPSTIDEPIKGETQSASNTYTKLVFLAPKLDQSIRANDGDVSAMVSIKPPLKKGHQLAFSIDGKSMGKSSSRTKNFSNLSRGSHTITVKVVDLKGKVLKSSSVGFNVLRASSFKKAQSNQAKKITQTRSYQEARKDQILNGS